MGSRSVGETAGPVACLVNTGFDFLRGLAWATIQDETQGSFGTRMHGVRGFQCVTEGRKALRRGHPDELICDLGWAARPSL